MYRKTDEEMETCAYTVLGQRSYSFPAGILDSHDNLFKLTLHGDPMTAINIKTINITECGLYNLDDVQIGVSELPLKPDLFEVLKYAKRYTQGEIDFWDALFWSHYWSIS